MTTSLADAIKGYEPLRTSVATVGARQIIGYGHDASTLRADATCDEDRAEAWLAEDARNALFELASREIFTCNMEQASKEALAHLGFWLSFDTLMTYERAVWLAGLKQYGEAVKLFDDLTSQVSDKNRLAALLGVLSNQGSEG